jgi:glycosyltransferase involved in cell wall biosynthesis
MEAQEISALSGNDAERPLWSVMIPTYNPRPEHLEQALRSVLMQDPGPDRMQIEVVDDCSPDVDVAALVKSIAGERVGFFRNAQNLGLAGSWNNCIDRSNGAWVHILHQDDYVLPGFYEHVKETAINHPDAALIAVRSFFIGDAEIIESVSPRVPSLENGGRTVKDFYYTNPLNCPGVVVRRDFYKKHGGFRADLTFMLDAEMWTRAIGLCGGVIVPEVLAAFRHRTSGENATSRLLRSAEAFEDYARLAEIYAQRYSDFDLKRARLGICSHAMWRSRLAAQAGDKQAAEAMLSYWKRHATVRQKARHFLGGLKRRVIG